MTILLETEDYTVETIGNWVGKEKRFLCTDCGKYTKKRRRSKRCVKCQGRYAAKIRNKKC